MHEADLGLVDRFIKEARMVRDFGVLNWGVMIDQIPGVEFYSQSYQPVPNNFNVAKTSGDYLVNSLGEKQGLKLVEVPEAHIALTDFVGVDGLFTWDLITCTGVAFRSGRKFGLGHLLAEAERDLEVFTDVHDLAVRVRADNLGYQTNNLPAVFDNPHRLYLSRPHEWSGMIITREGISFLKEVGIPNTHFEIAKQLNWGST